MDLIETTVAATYALTPRVKQLLLRADGHTFAHEPGQHVFAHEPGQHVNVRYEQEQGTPVYRPYSPVSGPGTDTLALAVKRYDGGTCSVWLHERTVGDAVPLTPPSGALQLRDPDRDVAFVATGTGLTPMLAMLGRFLREGTGRATLLFGERTQADLMYRATLDRLAAEHPAFAVRHVLSGEDWSGSTGYVQDHLAGTIDVLDRPHVYVCGVPQMVVDTQATLEEIGVSPDAVFSEGWEEGAVSD